MPDADRHLAGVRLGVGGEVGEALDLAFALDREVAGIVDHVAQEIVRVPVVTGLALDRDRHDRWRVDEADRVAVRLGRRESLEAGVAPAPGRFSTTMLAFPPSSGCRKVARRRAVWSVEPPAG